MSTISIYPKAWALFQQGRISITQPCGLVLLTDDYTYDEDHKDVSSIPDEAVVADINLNTLQYESNNNRFVTGDVMTQNLPTGKVITGAILYRQGPFEDESYLVWYSDDIEGFPYTTDGKELSFTFPSGVLVVAPSGYTAPDMASSEVAGASPFLSMVEQDNTNIIFNPSEFATPAVYTHTNGTRATYNVILTPTPDIIEAGGIDVSSIAQTIKIDNAKMKHVPRRDDKVLISGTAYIVLGMEAKTYTSDLYLGRTVAG